MGTRADEKKDRVIAEFGDARRRLLDAASSLASAQRDQVFLGVWSVKDVVAHLVGWDFANLEAAKALLAGELPVFYAHFDRDWRSFNEDLVARYKRDTWAEVLALVEDSHRQLVAFLRTVAAAEFDRDRGVRFKGYKVTIARLIRAEASDERTHLQQIEQFAQQKTTGSQKA